MHYFAAQSTTWDQSLSRRDIHDPIYLLSGGFEFRTVLSGVADGQVFRNASLQHKLYLVSKVPIFSGTGPFIPLLSALFVDLRI